jgi:serine/threonine protein kinase
LSLTPGTRLGVFTLIQEIGRGGMDEVYRARDTNLDRDVAIKVLPEAFAQDAERLLHRLLALAPRHFIVYAMPISDGKPPDAHTGVRPPGGGLRSYDLAPDGRFFLIRSAREESGGPAPSNLIAVQNWTEELKRLVPTN